MDPLYVASSPTSKDIQATFPVTHSANNRRRRAAAQTHTMLTQRCWSRANKEAGRHSAVSGTYRPHGDMHDRHVLRHGHETGHF